MRNYAGGSLEECNLRIPTIHQSLQLLSTGKHPLGQLLGRNRIRIFTIVQPRNQSRASGSTTAFVERPTNQSAVLVSVQSNVAPDIIRDAGLEGTEVGQEKCGGLGFGQWEREGNFTTPGSLAEVTVPNGWETNWIGCRP